MNGQLPSTLCIRVSTLARLSPTLQTVRRETQSDTTLTRDTALIGFDLSGPRVTCLFCPGFSASTRPTLRDDVRIGLRALRTADHSCDAATGPPVLRHGRAFITPDCPRCDHFTRLARRRITVNLLSGSHRVNARLG